MDEVIDGEQSIVYDQAENRLYWEEHNDNNDKKHSGC